MVAGLLLATGAAAQSAGADAPPDADVASGVVSGATQLPEATQAQIEELRISLEGLADTAAARAAGFRPVLGMVPTMGTHWVLGEGTVAVRDLEASRPQNLMFAPISGVESLVGVAYAYQAVPEDAPPEMLAGDSGRWHEHPELSPSGRVLTMLHVWFVDSPTGPFGAHNPWLPYLAVGVEPPDASRLEDEADAYRIRGLALALAETLTTSYSFARIQEREVPELFDLAELTRRRDAIRSVIPELEAASEDGDVEAWNAAADRAVAEWEAIRAEYLDAIPIPPFRAFVAAFYDEMLGLGERH